MILGIDPGLNGALAFYDAVFDEMHIVDMPTYELKTAKRKRRFIAETDLLFELKSNMPGAHGRGCAYLEYVSASPQMGVTSAFNFGLGFGTVRTALIAQGIPLTMVMPSVWKPTMNVPADKSGARKRASELFPQFAHLWPLAKHDGRAEAALIALYGSKQK